MAELPSMINEHFSGTLLKSVKLSEDSSSNCGIVGYVPIIEHFNGSFDNVSFETWIQQWEMVANKYNWPPAGWIYSVGIHLEGEALKAYANIVSKNDDWNNFRMSMIAKFDSISPVVSFMRIKYSACFGIDRYFHNRKWFAQLAGFTEQQAVEMMIEDLKCEFKQLQNQNITSFDQFYQKAKLIEKKLNQTIEPTTSEIIHLNPPERRKRSNRRSK